MPILEIDNLNYSYHEKEGETKAIKDINLQVNEGEFVILTGPSGCGKSTILSIIAGLLPLSPEQKRSIKLESKTTGDNVCENRKLGYMLQKDHLFEWLTLYKNVTLGLEINKLMTEENLAFVNELLCKYGLMGFIRKYPRELSGGMRQRAALIRTLALNPDILLLDEPFSALDYQTRINVGNDIGTIIKSQKKTAIMVTHDLSEAVSLGDRILVMSHRPGTICHEIKLDFNEKEYSPLLRRNNPRFQDYFMELWRYCNS